MPQITIADGRSVFVEDQRFAAFQALDQTPMAQGISQGLRARDAGEAMFFTISQLAYTEQESFTRQRTPMQYEELVPISFAAGEWAKTIEYEIYDFAGRGKPHSLRGRDIPLVDVAYARKSMPVQSGAIGYDYTIDELRESAHVGKPIDTRKMDAAQEGYARHLNDVALNGEAISGITGLFNGPQVPVVTAPTGTWATATADNMLNDINTLILSVWTSTAYNDFPTHVVLAPTALAILSSRRASPGGDGKTILQYVIENNIAKTQRNQVITFTAGYALETGGAGSTRRMMAYVKSDQRLIMHVPMPLQFLAPQFLGFHVQVPGSYKYSGVEFRFPKSAAYMDGI